jgi:hypothetical protein
VTTNVEATRRLFGVAEGGNWWWPRYNIALAQTAPVVREQNGRREVVMGGERHPRAPRQLPEFRLKRT